MMEMHIQHGIPPQLQALRLQMTDYIFLYQMEVA